MAQKRAPKIQVLSAVSVFVVVLTILVAPSAMAQVTTVSTRPLFLPAVTYDAGGLNPNAVAFADVNGDGKPDLVVANCEPVGSAGCLDTGNTADGLVAVSLGKGNGTFAVPRTFDSGGASATSVAVADVNGDGKPDLVVANCAVSGTGQEQGGCGRPPNSVVSVFLGNNDGTFLTPLTYASGGLSPHSVQVADLNGDGKPDIVLANDFATFYNSPNGTVGVLLGNGNGTFQNVVAYSSGAWNADSVAVADVNADTKLDLIVANGACKPNTNDAGCLGVLLGNGDGTFQPALIYDSGGGGATSVSVTDVNGDGRPDLLVANVCTNSVNAANTVGVLLGNGDGTFQAAVTYGSGGYWASFIAVADVNGDSKPDLLVANGCTGNCGNIKGAIAVLLNNGDGTFQPTLTFYSGGQVADFVTAADVNDDGAPDLLVANRGTSTNAGSVAVLLNTTNGYPTTTTLVSSRNPSFAGQTVNFTATVRSAVGPPPDGEFITFKSGSAALGRAPLSGGTASFTTSPLPVGMLTITASYSGDINFAGSTSTGLRQVVKSTTKAVTSTTLASSLNPSLYGQAVTWAAMVTTSGTVAPTGSVVFRWSRDGQNYTIGTAALNANGVAMLTRSNLNADPFGVPYPIVAVYPGDATNLGSTSGVLSQHVLQTKTAASIISAVNPSIRGQAVTFTAKITSPTVVVTGPVTFSVGSTTLGTAQLSGGVAKFTTSALPVGASQVKVTYYGNSNVARSSAMLVQTVN